MSNENKNPIIFIPGLMGSMGQEMIPRTGQWGFGVARWIYQPFIEELEQRGYKRGVNLFICYYDWRKSCCDIVQLYLIPLLLQVQEKCAATKIDLICHSMGGLVARTYIQGPYYEGDIDKLMMIGTPNKGSVDAYYLWTSGRLMDNKRSNRGLQGLLGKGYIWLLRKLLKIPFGGDHAEELHRQFPAIQDLLPSFDYGPVLVYREEEELIGVPGEYMLYRNTTVDRLNHNLFLLQERVGSIYCMIGEDFATTQYLVLDMDALQRNEEKIIDHISNDRGDGTVVCESASIGGAKGYYMKANHHNIVKGAIPFVDEIYGIKAEPYIEEVEKEKEPTTLHILCNPYVDLVIEYEGEEVMSFVKGKVHCEYEYICEHFDEKYAWIIIKGIPAGQYTGRCRSYENPEIDLFILGEELEKEMHYEEEAVLVQGNSYTYHVEFEVSTIQ